MMSTKNKANLTMWGKYLDILNCFNQEANKNVPKNKTQDKNNTSGT